MNPLLQQFIQEARDLLQDISTHLLALEDQPDSSALMTELFRQVHTLKGNSGLFDFPEMTRVLHAGEDLMDAVREGRVRYSRQLADPLLDAMDFVAMLIDRIEPGGSYDAGYAAAAEGFARNLRALLPEPTVQPEQFAETVRPDPVAIVLPALTGVPEAARMAAWRAAESGKPLFMLGYRPDDDCFYRGEDPLVLASSGTGLGLAISKIIVDMHHGRIWFESSGINGKGSVFSFTLPIVQTEE